MWSLAGFAGAAMGTMMMGYGKEMVADLVLRNYIVKKELKHAGLTLKFKRYMRFTASEK
jgi:hypothetical protein